MKKLLCTLLLPALGFSLLSIGAAQAAPKPDKTNHGQCVSSSPKPDGKGGRSAIAKDKNACATPVIDCTGYTTNGNAVVDSATNSAVVSASPPDGSSVECSPGIAVVAGQILSFDYVLTGTTCGGGVPRAFLLINGDYDNTFDDYGPDPLPGACGHPEQPDGGVGSATQGTVSYTITDSGTLDALGLVFDQSSGSVTYSNVTINGVAVDY